MSSVSLEEMRNLISFVYPNPEWKRKVNNMPDNQVNAIYLSFCARGMFNKRAKAPEKPPATYEPELLGGCSDMKVIFEGEIHDVLDITEHSYIVTDEENLWTKIPKNLCEVI